MRGIYYTALVLLIVGGINWGLVGLANIDLVAAIFGEMTALSRAVYALVGLSALIVAAYAFSRDRIAMTNGSLRSAI